MGDGLGERQPRLLCCDRLDGGPVSFRQSVPALEAYAERQSGSDRIEAEAGAISRRAVQADRHIGHRAGPFCAVEPAVAQRRGEVLRVECQGLRAELACDLLAEAEYIE